MENLTQTFGVVKPNVPLAPMEGHKVVVFEETMDGSKLVAILNPGDISYKKKFHLLSPPPSYICYAVTSDTKLSFDFSAEMALLQQHQSFTLNCFVYYHVSDPGAMALAFNTDPIRCIRYEIKIRLQINILLSKIRLENILNDFLGLKDKILPNATLTQLRDFVRAFGVIIDKIDITYKISQIYLEEDYCFEMKPSFIEEEEKRKNAEEEKERLRYWYEIRKIEPEHELEEKLKKEEGEIDELTYQIKLRLIPQKELDHIQFKNTKDTQYIEEMEDVKILHGFKRGILKLPKTVINNAIGTIDSPGNLERITDSSLDVEDGLGNTSVPTGSENGNVKGSRFEDQLNGKFQSSDMDEQIKKIFKKLKRKYKINKLRNVSKTKTIQQVNQLYRHTKVDFPKKCAMEQEVELLVQLTIEEPLKTVVAQLVPIPILDSNEPIKLTLQVTAPGFHIDNPRKTMNVPANDDSEKVIFKMKPLSTGNQLVEVEIYFNALRIGYFGLEIQVEEVCNAHS